MYTLILIKRKLAGAVSLISDKVGFKGKNSTRDKNNYFILIIGLIIQRT